VASGEWGRRLVSRGVPQLKLDLKLVRRSDLLVHPKARAAYEYYRDFLQPKRCSNAHPSMAVDRVSPIVEVVSAPDHYLLVADFPKLRIFDDKEKRECGIYRLDGANHGQIEDRAWRSVMQYEPFSPAPSGIVCAKIQRLIEYFPERLISECLPPDPKTGEAPRITRSALARALNVSLSTLNNELPRIRTGGVSDVTIQQIFFNNQEGSTHG